MARKTTIGPAVNGHSLSRRTTLKGLAALTAAGAAGFPAILKAQGAGTIRIGMPTILSGRVAILGQSSVGAATMVVKRVNAAGGIDGRKIELVIRDSKGVPQEAAKVTRDLINEGCELILDAEASSGAFAVHEVIKDAGCLCIHTCSETSSLSANPKIHVPTAFRAARQGIHDAVGGGEYAAKIAKEKGLKKWMTCSPDYAYGRDNTAEFMEYAKYFEPSIEVVDQAWPKLFQPDYTEVVTKILQAKPQALYSALWGGDLVAFIDQGNLYGLFSQTTTFSVNLGDYPVLTTVKNLPPGMHSGSRYNYTVPQTPENKAWYDSYLAENNKQMPTNWSWQNALAMEIIVEALKQAKSTDGKKLAEAVKGMKIKSPFGQNGTITMRAEDNTIVDYVVGYGVTVQKDPYITGFQSASWDKIYELEKEWKKKQGYV